MLIERAGERLVAKTTRRTPGAISWLTRVHEQATAAGFIVPRFVPSQQGELVVDGVTVEQWLEGSPASPQERQGAVPLLRAFQGATRNWAQRPGFASSRALLQKQQGGDVDLAAMPQDLVEMCRAAWRELVFEPVSVVHGDLNVQNLLRTPEGRLALIDWDEARVDASILDEVALAPRDDMGEMRWERAMRALEAWEVTVSWHIEPAYAHRLATELRTRTG
jgi:hypothetical protein